MTLIAAVQSIPLVDVIALQRPLSQCQEVPGYVRPRNPSIPLTS